MGGKLVEQTILNCLKQELTMELEVLFNGFMWNLGQHFHIENIPINNLPLQVEPIVVWMCFKVRLLLHLISISLCHLTKKISISNMIWIKVQSMVGCNDRWQRSLQNLAYAPWGGGTFRVNFGIYVCQTTIFRGVGVN